MSKRYWIFKPLKEWGSKARKYEESHRNKAEEERQLIFEQLDEQEDYYRTM